MHRYNLRSRGTIPSSSPGIESSIDPAAVLALVAANVPLPTETQAALRLTCRATKLAVDDGVKELVLGVEAATGIRAVENPLTAGLTCLRLELSLQDFDVPSVENALTIASINAPHIEKLELDDVLAARDVDAARVVLGALGAATWPSLRSLSISCLPGTFDTYIDINKMPKLTELHLYTFLCSTDIDALHARNGKHFPSTLEVLTLEAYAGDENENKEYFVAVGEMLETMSPLRRLELDISECQDLSFLSAAEMPSLEYLDLPIVNENVCMRPIIYTPRPRLRTLSLMCREPSTAYLKALASNLAVTFPALESFEFAFFDSEWDFLHELKHPVLKELALTGRLLEVEDVEAVGAALARLPALESLEICPFGPDMTAKMPIDEDDAFQILLSGPPLPRLRRLTMGGCWKDNDDSLWAFILNYHKVPNLEDIHLIGCISPLGFADLAEAGRQGRWPRLKKFEIYKLVAEDGSAGYDHEDFCRSLLQEVWPDLAVEFRA